MKARTLFLLAVTCIAACAPASSTSSECSALRALQQESEAHWSELAEVAEEQLRFAYSEGIRQTSNIALGTLEALLEDTWPEEQLFVSTLITNFELGFEQVKLLLLTEEADIEYILELLLSELSWGGDWKQLLNSLDAEERESVDECLANEHSP